MNRQTLLVVLKVLTLEIVYFYALYFILSTGFFLYYGSGAGSSSPDALLAGDIATLFLVSSPLLFNFYKVYTFGTKKVEEQFYGYAIIQILFVLFLVYQYIFGYTLYFNFLEK
jgi:hypothetical protein